MYVREVHECKCAKMKGETKQTCLFKYIGLRLLFQHLGVDRKSETLSQLHVLFSHFLRTSCCGIFSHSFIHSFGE